MTPEKERLIALLDEALDMLALAWFNFGMTLRSPRIANLNVFIPFAGRFIK